MPPKTRLGAGVRTCGCSPNAFDEDPYPKGRSHVPAAPWSGVDASGLIRVSSSLVLVAPAGAGSMSRTGALSCGSDNVMALTSAGCGSDATAPGETGTPGVAEIGNSPKRTPAPAIATTAIRPAMPLANRTIFATNLVAHVAPTLVATLRRTGRRTTPEC